MPNYSYKCLKCNLDDVKRFLYKMNPKTGNIDLRICEDCSEPVERVWKNPSADWYRSIRSDRT